MRIAIAGGGIAGLCAALVLGRDGHEVVVVERDRDLSSRSGVPQYLQPHILLALGCCELARHTPDVYAEMVAHGAVDVDMNHPRLPHNPDMRALGFRRELLERVLRQAALDSDVELNEEANTAACAVLASLTPPVVPTQSEVVAALNAWEGLPPRLD